MSGICGICLSGEKSLVLFGSNCSHKFCPDCLTRCRQHRHNTCPMCRRSPGSISKQPQVACVAPSEPLWRQQLELLDCDLQNVLGHRLCNATLHYDSNVHGWALSTLRGKLLDVDASVLMLLDPCGLAVGVATGFPWQLPCRHPYGTPQSFLFHIRATTATSRPTIWRGVNGASDFMYSKQNFIAFGSGAGREDFGLKVDGSLTVATSEQSSTFDNIGLGKLDVVRVLAFAWGESAANEGTSIQFGSSDQMQRAEARMLIGNTQRYTRDWFG